VGQGKPTNSAVYDLGRVQKEKKPKKHGGTGETKVDTVLVPTNSDVYYLSWGLENNYLDIRNMNILHK
jgi:hypothetical protein